MSFLAKFRVLTKVLAIICVLSLITGIMAWLGISSLHSVSERSDTMARSAARALLATRANNNVVAMNRAEFRSALDPRDENRLAARAVIDEQVKQLEERLAEVSKTTDEKTQALLPAVRSALSTYQSQMKQTLQSVDDAKSAEVTQSAAGLREVAMKSRAAAEALQIAIRAVANRLDQRVMENNKAGRSVRHCQADPGGRRVAAAARRWQIRHRHFGHGARRRGRRSRQDRLGVQGKWPRPDSHGA